MKNHIFKLGILFVFIFGACSEDFLEMEPIGLFPTEQYFQNQDQVDAAVIAIYDEIQNNNSGGHWSSSFFIKNLLADDCLAGGGDPSDQSDYQFIDDYKVLSSNQKVNNIFSNYYRTINASNLVINRVGTKVDITDAEKVSVAEAKALRAYQYFDLVNFFGPVPLMIENPTVITSEALPRAPKTEIYAQIEKDLTEAISNLQLKSKLGATDKFRMTKGAAQGLLGKAYLFQEKYDKAAIVFAELISSGEYDLEANFEDVWSAGSEFGIESLFEVSYTSAEGYSWGSFAWDKDESNIEVQLQGVRGDWLDSIPSTLNLISGWGFNNPSTKIGDLFVAENETSRYTGTLISPTDFIAAGGEYADGKKTRHDFSGYIRLKYATKVTETAAPVNELNYTTNFRLMRYADVLLMAAEAYHKNGDDVAAQAEILKVRNRAGFMDPITEAGTDLFDLIVKERQLELAFEGVRFFDLVRWGLAEQELTADGFVKGVNEVLPIPMNEITANPAISEGDQNAGY